MIDEQPSATELKERIDGKTAAIYKNVESVQDQLGELEVEGCSDQKLVKLILTGQHELKKLSIDPALLKKSNKDIEESIITAYQDARIKVEEQVKLKMVEIAKDLGFYNESE